MSERRHTARIEKLQLVQVSRFDEEGFHADMATGRTLNLSPGGMRLELAQPLPLRSVVTVSVALGETILDVTGTVVYLEAVDDERVAVGISFADLPDEVRNAIEGYLDLT